jgi:tetratricopeptide (TPR) repeat protein
MLRLPLWRILTCVVALTVCVAARASDDGQALLDKATDTKLAAENIADLNEVIRLCEEAIKAGLDEGELKFANGLLASTLTQRAEMVCLELFERPVTPSRARKLVPMALADLTQTLEIDANQGEAQYLIGRLHAQLGDTKKALKALSEAIRLSSDDPPAKSKALMIRANVQQEPAARLADYDEAVKLTPRDPNVLRFRGMYHLTQNNIAEAVADLSAAIDLDPKDPDTYEARGIALALALKYDDAMESFNKSIELDPDAPSAYTQRSRIRAIKGDTSGALADVEHALKLEPRSATALQLRASIYSAAGKYDKALADLNVLREGMPDNSEVLLQIAALYQATKKPEKAISTYAHLLEADPKNAAGYRGRADAYLNQGNQAGAIEDYEAALKIEPKNSGVLNNLAWVLATSPDQRLRNGKRAIELATAACDVTEYKQAHILSTLAAGYAETGDFDTAINWSKKAVEMSTEQLKAPLTKELESYQAKKPWREATPPEIDEPDQTAQPERGAAPSSDDTARSKRGS